jgi:NADPH:quinone reductase-like Zn-dependent oxidoreductase
VVIGVGGGARAEVDLLGLMARRATLTGATLRARDHAAKAEVARGVAHHVLPLLAAGRIRVPVCATFPMAEAEAAYARFAAGAKFGKIVLRA